MSIATDLSVRRIRGAAAVELLPLDLDGDPYRVDDIGPWKVTHCCGAYAKGMEGGIACRNCYEDIDPFYDGPARLDDAAPVPPRLGPVRLDLSTMTVTPLF